MESKEKYLLRIEHVSKDFYGNKVLKDINISVKPGEIIGLVGENGAGKSTLMNILFGNPIIHKTGGFEGKIIHDETKPDGTPRKLMDVSRINQLGWKYKTELREGLTKTYKWFKENLEIRREN